MSVSPASTDRPHPADARAGLAPLDRLDPAVRAVLEPAESVAGAEAAAKRLAHSHYENFSVVSLLLPRDLRQDLCNVYAFCRLADDLGDELADPAVSLKQLAKLREDTCTAFAGRAESNLLVAVAATARRRDLPPEPFLDLISAFEQDQRVTRYETFDELRDYCRRSADPVGRLVLMMCGYRDVARMHLSDQTCTALQLVNFWQDVRRDLVERDRIYLPAETMAAAGLTEAALRVQVARGRADEAYRRVIRAEVERADAMFAEGRRLLPMLRPAVRGQIALFGAGGMAISRAIARQGYDTLCRRPKLSKWAKARLACVAATAAAVTAAGDAAATIGRWGSRGRSAPAGPRAIAVAGGRVVREEAE